MIHRILLPAVHSFPVKRRAPHTIHSFFKHPLLLLACLFFFSDNTMKLGRYLGCVHPVASEVWSCILTRSTDDIVQAVSSTAVPSIPVEFNRYLFLPSHTLYEVIRHQNYADGLLNALKFCRRLNRLSNAG
uniref:F-box domain-containing protein n=1 Tax=Globodera pallida TaxID=36090 RepID=A0A183CJE1_GLOPA